ncbi:MAG: efflux RND transporter periplasmic adaptor subunit [Pirellulales bacterium]
MNCNRATVAVYLVLWSFGLGCGRNAPQPVQLAPPAVTAAQPVRRPVTEFLDYTGRTTAVEEVSVYARVSGYLKRVHFTDGQEVKAGATLFQIDPRPFEANVARAEAVKDRYKASIKKAENDLARFQRLEKSGNVTRDKIDEAIAERDVNEASLREAEAQLEIANLDLEYTKITAPIDGRLSATTVTDGNLISVGANGPPLTTLVRLDPIYVYFNVDEQTMLRYQADARAKHNESRIEHIRALEIPVMVGLSTDKGEFPYQGLLDFADNQVSASTGTIRVRAVLDNADRALTPGLFVRVRLPFGEPRETLLIDETCILADQDKRYVFVVKDDDVCERRYVRVGALFDGQRELLAGLKENEWIVVNGLQRARDGRPVKPDRLAPPAEEKPATSRNLEE